MVQPSSMGAKSAFGGTAPASSLFGGGATTSAPASGFGNAS